VLNCECVNVTSPSAASQGVISKRVSSSTPYRSVGSLTLVVPLSPFHVVSFASVILQRAAAASQRSQNRPRAPTSSPCARVIGVIAGLANAPRTSFEW
jgi:hypothetical protein